MSSVIRIEMWHGGLLAILLIARVPFKLLEPKAFLFGGGFMALNFFLLSFGVRWALAPLADKRRVRTGMALLVVKLAVFLGLLTLLFLRFEFDVLSFALGFSTLLLA